MSKLISLSFMIITLSACNSTEAKAKEKVLPAWLQEKISTLEKTKSVHEGVMELTIKNKKYYQLPVPCCDIMVPLYSEDGKLVCHPSGGFSGHGDGKCDDLMKNISAQELVWTAPLPQK